MLLIILLGQVLGSSIPNHFGLVTLIEMYVTVKFQGILDLCLLFGYINSIVCLLRHFGLATLEN